jgi:hypothetical protein
MLTNCADILYFSWERRGHDREEMNGESDFMRIWEANRRLALSSPGREVSRTEVGDNDNDDAR